MLLLSQLKLIERDMGRRPNVHSGYSARLIDLDIIFYDAIVLTTDNLIIPHPRVYNRRFVLEPLSEINPNFICPKKKITVLDCLLDVQDDTEVKLYAQ